MNHTQSIEMKIHAEKVSQPARSLIQAARDLVKEEHRRGIAALNEIFRIGIPPDPLLHGVFAGELIAIDLATGLAELAEWRAADRLPWKGKAFNASSHVGINLFSRDSLLIARLIWPFYSYITNIGPETYRAFPFRSYLAPGLEDADRQVLKIDYDLKVNPTLSVRRVLDELVQIADGYFLGKAHLKWWWGRWQRVAFFTLEKEND